MPRGFPKVKYRKGGVSEGGWNIDVCRRVKENERLKKEAKEKGIKVSLKRQVSRKNDIIIYIIYYFFSLLA